MRDASLSIKLYRWLLKLYPASFREAFTDTVGLRVFGLAARVIDVFYRQVELIFVMLTLAAVFGSSICQNAQ